MPENRLYSGYSLTELLIAVAIVGLVAGIAVPSFMDLNRRSALRSAAGELRAILHLARMRAVARHANCGVKFFLAGGEWQYALYDDGDGDGVRNADIDEGVDSRVAEPRRALRESSIVAIGLLGRDVVDPDGVRLPSSASPVQFGRSAICSFSPMGESTPGTIYLTDRGSGLYAVRVYGLSAKIRTLRYDIQSRRWVNR